MTNTCATVAPGEILNGWQKTGLELVTHLQKGRDVVLAIDLTESVGLNDEGKIRLSQIIKDSLKPGDSVYIVPFASTVNPLERDVNPIQAEKSFLYQGRQEDIETIIQALPFKPNLSLRQTDIQLAELFIYRELAQINQCRLGQHQPIKPQSVVWITDAPLLTPAGITSDQWLETPADSPFRQKNSPESQEREKWLQVLPIQQQSKQIITEKNQNYKLTVVDIAPTVQEFCTPAPGGKETCIVTPYLLNQLWLPASILSILIIAFGCTSFWALNYLLKLKKKWKLKIEFESSAQEEQICYLANNKRISIGIGDEIDCPGFERRAYLQRQGNKLFLVPTNTEPIYYKGVQITRQTKIDSSLIRINCPDARNQEFEIRINIIK